MPKEILDDHWMGEEEPPKPSLSPLEERERQLLHSYLTIGVISLLVNILFFGVRAFFERNGTFIPSGNSIPASTTVEYFGVVVLLCVYPGIITKVVYQLLFFKLCKLNKLDQYIYSSSPEKNLFEDLYTYFLGCVILPVFTGLLLMVLMTIVVFSTQPDDSLSKKSFFIDYGVAFYGTAYFIIFSGMIYLLLYTYYTVHRSLLKSEMQILNDYHE